MIRHTNWTDAPSRTKSRRATRWVIGLSWANLAAVCCVVALLQLVSESWWVGSMVVYLPRFPWAIPAVILLPISLRMAWKFSFVNLAALLLIAGPVMNFQTGGWFRPAIDHDAYRLTVVSCNVQSFRPDFPKVINELHRIDPDVVLFQEAFEGHPLLASFFEGWNVHSVDEYLIASKLPLKFIDTGYVHSFERVTVAWYEVETPQGPVALFNIHQTSPRRSLRKLKPWSFVTGAGVEIVNEETTLREVEALKTRQLTLQKAKGQPAIMAGDFNMPNDSSLFQTHWGDLQDAYARASVGYGYTSPCHVSKSLWPENSPWAQVDHILATHHWQIERCWIGKSDGSDHRLMAAQLRLPKKFVKEEKPDDPAHDLGERGAPAP